MKIEHLVFLKFKPEANESQINELCSALSNLKSTIPSILDVSVGKNFSDRSKGFQLGLRVLVNSRDGLQTYLAHPDHVSVVTNLVKPILEDMIVVDYVA